MAVGLQYFFEGGQRGPILGELSFEHTARGAIDVARRFFIFANEPRRRRSAGSLG